MRNILLIEKGDKTVVQCTDNGKVMKATVVRSTADQIAITLDENKSVMITLQKSSRPGQFVGSSSGLEFVVQVDGNS